MKSKSEITAEFEALMKKGLDEKELQRNTALMLGNWKSFFISLKTLMMISGPPATAITLTIAVLSLVARQCVKPGVDWRKFLHDSIDIWSDEDLDIMEKGEPK